ncbi:titin isoform X2 [Hippocampus comes]|uniref:non-specific serine/threonine protein kinase n=1 Tax=Hippocampus comes TaxID=109280 RepID=A0A3Q3DDB7_HIPCM|nr:PREDICTED: titin-like isoform X2 [Hippocampus comes]
MTSRRPMTRSFSANGRTSSFSEEDSTSLNGRTETRNNYLSNVRPENRSTLCAVMAQLTEDVQPSFETTLKSKAVSENCNVKFTCVVSGYPAPELKWYKDDMEMDRYCGLPKYEIHKNGKTHTLQIYNCTLDDAAIYQVSASNSKGIVSCSGVLEVGTMSEFKIHQRFFAKLKQKAEKKRKDLEEQNKKGVRDNIQTEEPHVSPEPPPRKRPVPGAVPVQAANEREVVEQLRSAAGANGVSFDVKGTASAIPLDNTLEKNMPAPEELVAKKKPKITNGVDAGVNTTTNSSSSNRGHVIENGGENCYDGGMGLAQFLSEALQSQTAEESENSSQLEKPQRMDVCSDNASGENEGRLEKLQVEREKRETAQENETIKEKYLVIEREKEKERFQEVSHFAEHPKHHRKSLKDHDHHTIQSSISSMLHTVKDFLFGKGKKDSHESIEHKDKEHDHLPKSIQPKATASQTPPSYRLYKKHRAEMDKAHSDQVVPMETDKPKEPPKCVDVNQQSASKKLSMPQEPKVKVEAVKSPMSELTPGSPKEPSGQRNQETGVLVENMEVSAGERISSAGQQTQLSGLQVLTEAEEKHPEVVSSADMLLSKQESSHLAVETTSSTKEDTPFSQSFLSPSSLFADNQAPPPSAISATATSRLCVTPTEALQGGEAGVEKMAKGNTPDKEVNKPSKKVCVANNVTLKELPHPSPNKPEATVLTPPSLEKGKPDKEVNYPPEKIFVETEEKLKKLPRPNINRNEVAVSPAPLLEKGQPDNDANHPPKKLCVKTEEKLKEQPSPDKNRPKVAIMTQPSLKVDKPGKEVNYPDNRVCVETEEKLKKVPRPNINRTKVGDSPPALLENGKPEQDTNYPSKKLCVETEEKVKEQPRPDINRPKVAIIAQPSPKVGKPDKEVNYPSNKVREETDEKLKELPLPDTNIPNVLTVPLLEEAASMREIKTANQTLVSDIKAFDSQSDHAQEEAEKVSVTQKMNVEFLPAAAPKMVDLKMWSGCTPSFADESKEDPEQRPRRSSEFVFTSRKMRGERQEGVPDARLTALEENLNNLTEQKQVTVQPIETNNNVSEMVTEKKTPAVSDEFDKKSDKISRDKKDTKEVEISLLEDASNMAHKNHTVKQQRPSEKVPLSLSSDDTAEVKESVSDKSTHEHIAPPKIEVIQPQPKQFTLPLTILALKKIESEPSILEKHLKPQVIARDVVDSSGLLPKQKDLHRDNKRSPSHEAKDPGQLDDKTEIIAQEEKSMKASQQLPEVDYATIPQINVSCSDDKEDHSFLKTYVLDSPQASRMSTVPLFVVPLISEPLVVTQSVRQLGTGSAVTAMSEKSQDMSEQSFTEILSSIPNETVLQRRNDVGPSLSKATEDDISLEILKAKPLKQAKIDTSVTVEDLLRSRAPVERLTHKPPTHPSLSPGSIRKYMTRAAAELESDAGMTVPVITVDERQSDKPDEDMSGGSTPTSSTPTSSLSCESSPRLKRKDSLSLIRSATPEELASGARRKIFIPKPKDDTDTAAVALEAQNKKESPYMSPSQARRAALLQAPVGPNTPPMERRSPLMNRRKATLEVPKMVEEPPKEEPAKGVKEEKVAEKKLDPLKAPQVIRKIRGEPFPDASGHLKLWCQFFNVLSDSTIKWFRDEEEILEVKRSAGDETQVALAIVLAANQDCGVYGCSIQNEYGTDTTDFLLSVDILSDILLRDDLEVGEEIEMTPLLFTKGLANSGNWGDKYFGRIMTETAHIGEGCSHKASRVKVIYGLNPVYESGSTCIIKVPNPIAYGTKQDNNLIERNLEMTKQECKIQNMMREYCKIFAAEARVLENFGSSLEVIPLYLMYRPANSVPYATVEVDLGEVFLKYCVTDAKGRLIAQSASEIEQKCSTFQHWIHQWTHGNLLITRMEGVEMKITNVRVATKTKGYQGLTACSSPEVFEQFPTVHLCNYYCGLLGLRPLKTQDQQQTTKVKGSRSPLFNRKTGSGSPQPHRKGHSPQMARKSNVSPKVTRKAQETEDNDSNGKLKVAETTDPLEIR